MKKYYINTIGCQMNKADSERIVAYLEGHGLEAVDNAGLADLAVLVTCGVRQSAEDRVYGLVERIKNEQPGIVLVLTGCLSERPDVLKRIGDRVDIWLPIAELPVLADKLGLGLAERQDMSDYLSIRPKLKSKISAFVPIGNGCDNFCTYCVVPYARHRENYRPALEIEAEVADLAANGYKEITLIAQNVNSYRDGAVDFPRLLRQIAAIPGDFWLRFATSHPKDMSRELIRTVAGEPKLCRYIHLPAQSGNNEILGRMNRDYTVEHYLDLVRQIYEAMPDVGLTTDIIVGFPGETREQFEDTLELFRQARFDMAYIARYSPRPGTTAYKLKDDVGREEKKWREEELMKVLRQTARAKALPMVGQELEVLVEGQNRKGDYYGKTKTFKSVRLRGQDVCAAGQVKKVKISAAADFGLAGIIKKRPFKQS